MPQCTAKMILWTLSLSGYALTPPEISSQAAIRSISLTSSRCSRTANRARIFSNLGLPYAPQDGGAPAQGWQQQRLRARADDITTDSVIQPVGAQSVRLAPSSPRAHPCFRPSYREHSAALAGPLAGGQTSGKPSVPSFHSH